MIRSTLAVLAALALGGCAFCRDAPVTCVALAAWTVAPGPRMHASARPVAPPERRQ